MSRLFYCTCLLLVVDKWTGDDIGHGLLRLVLVLVQVPVEQVRVVHHSFRSSVFGVSFVKCTLTRMYVKVQGGL